MDLLVTQEDLKWDQRAEEARFSGLAAVQASAERWGATILVITGLLTALTVVRGPSDLAALRDTNFKIAVGIASLCALLVALASVVLAALAAQGQAVRIHPTGDQFRRESLEGAELAHNRLQLSRFLSLFVIPLYLVAVAIMAYAPQASDKPPQITITDKSGTRYCGNSARIVQGFWIIETDIGTSGRVKLSDVASVGPVETCEKTKKQS
ncbi:hypothetical protein OHB41_30905 [Streptomyces sp. NBC_01571]|uniref:hypothetical protein n=1 Tax=Streptomyces sp. NBC_01571 TaxID=2975883 RepID=UPI00225443F3|nr:hypothetical protein [Streptomyces sp. NBC_01571]MCX4577515.1 hypothetical protein [Streptomyces sp. NBC_01571]